MGHDATSDERRWRSEAAAAAAEAAVAAAAVAAAAVGSNVHAEGFVLQALPPTQREISKVT